MDSQRPLFIDAQLLQTAAWDRGMGHYSRSLLKAMSELGKRDDVTIILNKNLELDEGRERAIAGLVPGARIVRLDLPTISGDIKKSKKEATRKLDAYLEEAFPGQELDFLILQLFTFDYCAAFPTSAYRLVICYDLIPLIYWSRFSGMFAPHMYFPHLATLFEADRILSISETTKHQLEDQLSIRGEKITNLNGAYIERPSPKEYKQIPDGSRFILMPTADLAHKNNESAVRAFAKFNQSLGDIFTLVITSDMSEITKSTLRCYTDKLIFTGNISDPELEYLYVKSEAVMLVSSIEGLGLPVLEAVSHNKPVICSSIGVFKEISETAFYYCQPEDENSMISAIESAMLKSSWDAKRSDYAKIGKTYTWTNTAKTLLASLGKTRQSPSAKKDSLAVVMPHPASNLSDLGGFVQSLLPAMAQHADVKFYVDGSNSVNEKLKPYFAGYLLPSADVNEFLLDSYRGSKAYFIDDSYASIGTLRAAMLYPGVCFITTKKAKNLFEYLQADGYITPATAEAASRIAKNGLADLLREGGNKVFVIGAHGLSLESLDSGNTYKYEEKYDLGEGIIETVFKGSN